MDFVGFPPQESGLEVGTFLGSFVAQTELALRLASVRSVIEHWTLPPPPAFWK